MSRTVLVLFWTASVFAEGIAASQASSEGRLHEASATIMPDETPLKSIAERKAQDIKAAAKKKADQASSNSSYQAIQDQIRLLNEKIDHLEAGRTISTPSLSVLPDENMPNIVTN